MTIGSEIKIEILHLDVVKSIKFDFLKVKGLNN